MNLDVLYILGLLVVWYGNFRQIKQIVKRKSTRSFSLFWIAAIFLSITIRLPRAVTSTYWAWSAGYKVSWLICLSLLIIVYYYRRKYPND